MRVLERINCKKIKRLENVIKGLRRDLQNSNRYANRVLRRTNKELKAIHKLIIKKSECIADLIAENHDLKRELSDANILNQALIDNNNIIVGEIESMRLLKSNSKRYFNLLINNRCISRTKKIWIAEAWAKIRESHGFSTVTINK